MGVIDCFVIHIELAILKLTGGIIVFGSPLVGKLVVAVDVLDFQAIGRVPGHGELHTLLIELFTIQAVGRSTNIVTTNTTAEYAIVVSCCTFRAGDTKPVKRCGSVSEARKRRNVDAQPVMLGLHVGARRGINEVQNRLRCVIPGV